MTADFQYFFVRIPSWRRTPFGTIYRTPGSRAWFKRNSKKRYFRTWNQYPIGVYTSTADYFVEGATTQKFYEGVRPTAVCGDRV